MLKPPAVRNRPPRAVNARALRGEEGAAAEPRSRLPRRRPLPLEGALFRELIDAAPDALAVVDEQGTIVLVNAEAERMFGWKRKELLGRPVEVLVPERFQQRHVLYRASYARCPRTRTMGAGLELYGRYRDGSEFPVEVRLAALPTPQGLLVACTIREVGERSVAEETPPRPPPPRR